MKVTTNREEQFERAGRIAGFDGKDLTSSMPATKNSKEVAAFKRGYIDGMKIRKDSQKK